MAHRRSVALVGALLVAAVLLGAVQRAGEDRDGRCDPSEGVAIATGDNAQRVVDAHGAGTRYGVKAGIHLRNFSVRPKSGDTSAVV